MLMVNTFKPVTNDGTSGRVNPGEGAASHFPIGQGPAYCLAIGQGKPYHVAIGPGDANRHVFNQHCRYR
jgi:hypothetical protein